jgi:apolipoprotein N-acyltransferase
VHGLTLLTVLVACSPALGRRGIAMALAGLVAWAGFGAWRLAAAPPDRAADDLAVALLQGDIDEGQKWDRGHALADFRHYLTLTRDGAAALARAYPGLRPVVVWPETASPFLLTQDANARAAVAQAAGPGVTVLAGTVRFDRQDRPRNSLVVLQSAAEPAAIYDKWHLVPFGEYQPVWARIGIQLVPGNGFQPGPGPRTLHIPGLPAIGPLICYEAIFPGSVVDEADRPALMVNVTNDAWFGNSAGPRQHLAAARLRALEEGLPLVRAANTGISAAFDRYGRELGRLGLDTGGILTVRVHPSEAPPTWSARLGLAAPFTLAVLALAVGLPWHRRRRLAHAD